MQIEILFSIALFFGFITQVPIAPLEKPDNAELVQIKIGTLKGQLKISTKMRHGIEGDLKTGLKDPESARFGVMNAAKQLDGTITICGWVNAKNSYGGYSGEMPFIAVYSNKSGHAVMGSIEDFDIIEPTCQENGLSLHPNPMSSFPKNKKQHSSSN